MLKTDPPGKRYSYIQHFVQTEEETLGKQHPTRPSCLLQREGEKAAKLNWDRWNILMKNLKK